MWQLLYIQKGNEKSELVKRYVYQFPTKKFPVISEDTVALDFGTWALKVTPVHDPVDFALGQKHHLPLDIFAFDKAGIWSEISRNFSGKHIKKDFDEFIEYLQKTDD
jgi:valyl-tRNA synthetase